MILTDEQGNAEALFALENVTVTAAGNVVLTDVSWRADPGQHWVIVGPNGAGKTTLARLIVGRVRAKAGSVSVLGTRSEDHVAADRASRVGFASVEVGQVIPPHEKVLDVVLSSAWGQSVTFGEEYQDVDSGRAMDLMAALGVQDLAGRTFASLSEGERRRVLLARALMPDPELLILDEPTAGLDLAGREILVAALGEIMNGPSSPGVVLITHELEEIGDHFTHAMLLTEGQVTAAGPIEETLTSENLSAAFGIELQVSRVDGRWMATSARKEAG